MLQEVIALEKLERFQWINKPLNESIVSCLVEVRERSIAIWQTTPVQSHDLIPVMRSVFEREHSCYQRIIGDDRESPWQGRIMKDVGDEINFALPYREQFLNTIRGLSQHQLITREILHNGIRWSLINFLFNISFEEMQASQKLLKSNSLLIK